MGVVTANFGCFRFHLIRLCKLAAKLYRRQFGDVEE